MNIQDLKEDEREFIALTRQLTPGQLQAFLVMMRWMARETYGLIDWEACKAEIHSTYPASGKEMEELILRHRRAE